MKAKCRQHDKRWWHARGWQVMTSGEKWWQVMTCDEKWWRRMSSSDGWIQPDKFRESPVDMMKTVQSGSCSGGRNRRLFGIVITYLSERNRGHYLLDQISNHLIYKKTDQIKVNSNRSNVCFTPLNQLMNELRKSLRVSLALFNEWLNPLMYNFLPNGGEVFTIAL